jgi:hypothetical protein
MSLGPAVVIGAVAVALLLVLVAGWRTWRAWQHLWLTVDAAESLVGVHLDALDERTRAATDAVARLASGSERAAEAWVGAIAGVRELGVLRSAIADDRARLRRELLDLVLPTPPREGSGRG